uniref:Uncharacterized protein n=1 Tax=Phenylobacterium glaciei TaxID=2803784 RepID=A0A974S9E5_9CAUL|nr:hypothetical protein JKL49_05500 [Phenylobacterium glaciei]
MATFVGFDRGRAFYPVVLIVVASYHDLFAVMGGSLPALGFETLGLAAFWGVAVLGFRTNLWWIVAALAAHGSWTCSTPAWWTIPASRPGGRPSASPTTSPPPPGWPGACCGPAASPPQATASSPPPWPPAPVRNRRQRRARRCRGRRPRGRLSGPGPGPPGPGADLRPGDGMASFREVAPDLAAHATVILYDRAGYGGSGAPPALATPRPWTASSRPCWRRQVSPAPMSWPAIRSAASMRSISQPTIRTRSPA